MAQTSIHFQAVKGGSEEHNKRTKKLDYVHHERSSMNEYWESDTQEARLAFVTQNAKAKTGRKMQAKATPIREAVVVIEDTTTMNDLKKLAKRFNDRFGIDVFQIAIHKDEGYRKGKDGLKLNLHAHLVADWTDHQSGKSLKLNRNDMSEMQTICAEVLGMERGKSSEKQHLSAIQFKIAAEEQRAEAQTKAIALQSVLGGLMLHAVTREVQLHEGKLKYAKEQTVQEHKIMAHYRDLRIKVSKEREEISQETKEMRSQMQFCKGVVDSKIKRIEALRSEISGLSEQKNEVLKLVEQKEQLKKDVLILECRQEETQIQLGVLDGEVFMKEKSRDILQGAVAMYYCTSRWLTSLSEQPHPAVALMQGFTMVFCGCILLGLTVYLYLGYAEPQWTDLTMRQLAVTQGDNGLGRAMTSLVAHGHIPSAIQSSMFVMLLAMFGGCSATLLLTPLALRNNAKHRRPHKR